MTVWCVSCHPGNFQTIIPMCYLASCHPEAGQNKHVNYLLSPASPQINPDRQQPGNRYTKNECCTRLTEANIASMPP